MASKVVLSVIAREMLKELLHGDQKLSRNVKFNFLNSRVQTAHVFLQQHDLIDMLGNGDDHITEAGKGALGMVEKK